MIHKASITQRKKGKESHYFTILTDIAPVSINLSQTHISIVFGGTYGVFIVPSVPGGGRGGEGKNQVGITPDKKVSITPDIKGAVSAFQTI